MIQIIMQNKKSQLFLAVICLFLLFAVGWFILSEVSDNGYSDPKQTTKTDKENKIKELVATVNKSAGVSHPKNASNLNVKTRNPSGYSSLKAKIEALSKPHMQVTRGQANEILTSFVKLPELDRIDTIKTLYSGTKHDRLLASILACASGDDYFVNEFIQNKAENDELVALAEILYKKGHFKLYTSITSKIDQLPADELDSFMGFLFDQDRCIKTTHGLESLDYVGDRNSLLASLSKSSPSFRKTLHGLYYECNNEPSFQSEIMQILAGTPSQDLYDFYGEILLDSEKPNGQRMSAAEALMYSTPIQRRQLMSSLDNNPENRSLIDKLHELNFGAYKLPYTDPDILATQLNSLLDSPKALWYNAIPLTVGLLSSAQLQNSGHSYDTVIKKSAEFMRTKNNPSALDVARQCEYYIWIQSKQ